MNIHVTNWRKSWDPTEDEWLITLRGKGCAHRQIAKILGRTVIGIKNRCKALDIIGGGRGHDKSVVEVTIAKTDFPAFYAIGWQLTSFTSDTVQVEWRGNSSPRMILATNIE
jgi:hypothetical protein